MKTISLADNERIVAVVPDRCAGPGWSNTPVWVYIECDQKIRRECLQPDEQSVNIKALFHIGVEVQVALVNAIPTKRIAKRTKRSA